MTLVQNTRIGICASILLTDVTARADGPQREVLRARVTVEHAACASTAAGALYDAPSFLSLLRAELRNDGVSEVVEEDFAAPHAAEARLRIERPRCAADETSVIIHLVDPLTDKALARGVDLASTAPAARSRLLALASAELVRASWAEIAAERQRAVIDSVTRLGRGEVQVQMHAAPPTMPPTPNVAPPLPPEPEPVHAAWSLGPTLDLRHHVRHPGGLWSAGGRLAWHDDSVQIACELRGAYGTEGDPRGDLDIAAVLAGASVQARAQSSVLQVGLGPRADAGLAWAGGSNALANVQTARGRAGVLQVGLELEVAIKRATWSPRATLRAGDTILGIGVSADGRRTVGIDGPFFAAAFGADFGL